MKVKTIILRVLAIALSLAALISMAGGAYFSQMSGAGQSVNGENVAFGDWFETLNGESSILLGDAEGTWKGSEAFFIISIILLSLLIIAVVMQFFIKKNWLQIVVRIISIVALLAVLLAFVLLLAGCIQLHTEAFSVTYSYIPAVGAWLFLVFGLVGAGLGIACGSKLKNAKRK